MGLRLKNLFEKREPRTWDIPERDIPSVLQRYDAYKKTGSSEAAYRLWAKIYEIQPETKGVRIALKIKAGGIPYIEETLE